MFKRRMLFPIAIICFALLGAWWTTRLHGRYVDAGGTYVEFGYSGKAFTNLGAGGGETEITYEKASGRVTLHAIDGNPTLRVERDGTLCCGPGGLLRRVR